MSCVSISAAARPAPAITAPTPCRMTHALDVPRPRPKGEAHADLTRPLRHRARHHRVDAHETQEQRDDCGETDDRQGKGRRCCRPIDECLQRAHCCQRERGSCSATAGGMPPATGTRPAATALRPSNISIAGEALFSIMSLL